MSQYRVLQNFNSHGINNAEASNAPFSINKRHRSMSFIFLFDTKEIINYKRGMSDVCRSECKPTIDQETGEKVQRCECGGKATLKIDYEKNGKVQFICEECGKKYDACCYNCGEILYSTYDLSCSLCGKAVAKATPNKKFAAQKEIAVMQS
ncbi:hypothetical protein M0R01_01705 [bacterium]|nr:hypothetical protein [bacterium]